MSSSDRQQDGDTHGDHVEVATADGTNTVRVRRPEVVTVRHAPGQAEAPLVEHVRKPVEHVDVELDADFEALLAESTGDAAAGGRVSGRFEPGEKVVGTVEVISLHGEEVFLDLGGKATGYVLKEELRASDGELTVKQGDKLEGIVVGTDSNGVRIATSIGRALGDRQALADAFEAGLTVHGKVTGTNKGGYEVEVAGARGFCPYSQIDLVRPEDPEVFVGQTLEFKIIELKDGDSPVVSRQALLRAERQERAAEVRAKLEPGARMKGVVRSIQKFGVFVDLGGVDGLVPMSELAWSRIDDAHEVVKLGQQVEVVVLEVEEARDRIALSIRRAGGDPFEDAAAGLQVGAVVEGPVVRLTSFGAFVQIAPNVDGMVHVSDLAHHHVKSPREILAVGDTVKVRVLSVDLEQRRVALSLKALADDPWESVAARYAVDATVSGQVVRVEPFGAFIELEPGVTALLPASESGVPQGRPLQSEFKRGQTVEARVLRVDLAGRKLALTRLEEHERQSAPSRGRPSDRGPRDDRGRGGDRESRVPRQGSVAWKDTEQPAQAGLGSFGALLQAALKSDDKK
ncbi:MAG: S1 RNA-binding domain-containing protein [Myxococcota bacterium]